jgi:uncharacterized protein (TIRG00374 family)
MSRALSVAVGLGILGAIYWTVDMRELGRVLQHANGWWLGSSLALGIPIILLSAWRLQQLMPKGNRIGFGEAIRLILLAGVLNMVLPSNMGQLAKAYFMTGPRRLEGSSALSLVVFEKGCDVLCLMLWCVAGLVLFPAPQGFVRALTVPLACGLLVGVGLMSVRRFAQGCFRLAQAVVPASLKGRVQNLQQSWGALHDLLWSDWVQLVKVAGSSVCLWFLYLVQIWGFILALNAWAPFPAHLALAPLALLVGLIPVTFAGIGTRDSALIVLYQPFFNAPTAAALGLLCTLRYLLPAIAGLPWLGQYLARARSLRVSPLRPSC